MMCINFSDIKHASDVLQISGHISLGCARVSVLHVLHPYCHHDLHGIWLTDGVSQVPNTNFMPARLAVTAL